MLLLCPALQGPPVPGRRRAPISPARAVSAAQLAAQAAGRVDHIIIVPITLVIVGIV